MNWITEYVRPKLKRLTSEQKSDVAENLWEKCPSCEQMLFHKELSENLHVCHYCDYHFRLSASKRLDLLFDEGKYTTITLHKVAFDPLKFKDSKKYSDRLKTYREKTKQEDAILVGYGKIDQASIVVAALDFSFMGGSMGMAVGEGIITAAEFAIKRRFPLLIVSASGGARMQEGILSLMQMARTTIALQLLKEAKIPFYLLLTDPTTGGVSASFAMLGEIALAEPGATIGFTGARVIQETMREKLPEGFQTAEYLKDHGMVDMVVHRKDLKSVLSTLSHLIQKKKEK